MRHWSVRQIFVLLLAIFVTAGIGMSAVQTSSMTTKMAMSSDMGASNHDGCNACSPVGDGSGKAMLCISGCVAPVLAVLPHVEPMTISEMPISYRMLDQRLHGTEPSPDSNPPRPTDIV